MNQRGTQLMSTSPYRRLGLTYVIRHLLCSSTLCLALLICACEGRDSTTASQPENQEEPHVLAASTDDLGVADIQDADNITRLRVETVNENGSPLPGVDVTYLETSPYPIVAFNQSDSGDPAGMFQVVPGTGDAMRTAEEPKGIDKGVFILNYLDPTQSRLYDPEKDSFVPVEYPNLAEIRQIVDLDALRFYLLGVPGLIDRGETTIGSFRNDFDAEYRAHIMERVFTGLCSPEQCPVAHRLARLFAYSAGQDDKFRYQVYGSERGIAWFWLPLGVSAGVTIDSPHDGATITNEDERNVEVTGSIDLPPDVLTIDGAHVELWVNGAEFPGVISVGGDGSGEGALFSSTSLVQLAEGENTIRVVAYVSEVNRGLQNGPAGEAGEATVTLTYQGGVSDPHAPSLTQLTHPTSFPCPEGTVPVSFHFSDPDGDVVTAYEYSAWSVGGQTGDQLRSADVTTNDKFVCLRGTEGQCGFNLSYGGFNGGDWFRWEFWVEDATGLVSQKLTMTANITGDCSHLSLSPAELQGAAIER
jgi:hypothetical protein